MSFKLICILSAECWVRDPPTVEAIFRATARLISRAEDEGQASSELSLKCLLSHGSQETSSNVGESDPLTAMAQLYKPNRARALCIPDYQLHELLPNDSLAAPSKLKRRGESTVSATMTPEHYCSGLWIGKLRLLTSRSKCWRNYVDTIA